MNNRTDNQMNQDEQLEKPTRQTNNRTNNRMNNLTDQLFSGYFKKTCQKTESRCFYSKSEQDLNVCDFRYVFNCLCSSVCKMLLSLDKKSWGFLEFILDFWWLYFWFRFCCIPASSHHFFSSSSPDHWGARAPKVFITCERAARFTPTR